jgi:hypothetical protein
MEFSRLSRVSCCLLYYTIDRCNETGINLKNETKKLNTLLKDKGYNIILNETKLTNDNINDSNKILLNGIAIEDLLCIQVKENYCESCSSLTGSETYCRTIIYNGDEYEDIPVEAFREAVLKVVNQAIQ